MFNHGQQSPTTSLAYNGITFPITYPIHSINNSWPSGKRCLEDALDKSIWNLRWAKRNQILFFFFSRADLLSSGMASNATEKPANLTGILDKLKRFEIPIH
ncbi:hypothetical protein [Microbulbifer sp. A4B17]|uniref:hypothetical protein n=1 Tax=Microbulbifer sp. A4B17 TaxID=359370 RepID=UPI0018654E0B|nr:hypothetical protein [Microbulbifer sp. A4B17]